MASELEKGGKNVSIMTNGPRRNRSFQSLPFWLGFSFNSEIFTFVRAVILMLPKAKGTALVVINIYAQPADQQSISTVISNI